MESTKRDGGVCVKVAPTETPARRKEAKEGHLEACLGPAVPLQGTSQLLVTPHSLQHVGCGLGLPHRLTTWAERIWSGKSSTRL